jgi:hypothetical protein
MFRLLVSIKPGTAHLQTIGLWVVAFSAVLHFTPQDWFERIERRWQTLPSFAQAAVLVLFTGILGALSYQQRPFVYFQF